MKHRKPTLLLLSIFISSLFAVLLLYSDNSVHSQTRESSKPATSTQTPAPATEVIKTDIDLVVLDALVVSKKTARIVGGLKKEDFVLYEESARQQITQLSQDSLPLSVLLLIDRGGCLDPYGVELHRAAREAIDRLKPVDEIAIMSYASTSSLVQPFTHNRIMLENALHRIPPHNGMAPHCLNNVFADAADYMIKASNPAGRRVVILISGVTRAYNCYGGPSDKSAARAIYESGTAVCGIIPKVPTQSVENGIMTMVTRLTKIGGADYMDVQTLANETGGEVLSDKPEKLETTFQTLIEHLRSRYTLAFVSTNKKRDGTVRKLKLEVGPVQKSGGKLAVKTRRSYIAPRS